MLWIERPKNYELTSILNENKKREVEQNVETEEVRSLIKENEDLVKEHLKNHQMILKLSEENEVIKEQLQLLEIKDSKIDEKRASVEVSTSMNLFDEIQFATTFFK